MILNFVKGFLTLFLLMKVMLHLVPKGVFEKYISFFSGVVLVIGLLCPFLQLTGQEEMILEDIQFEHWEAELRRVAEEADKLEETGEKAVEDYYRRLSEDHSEIESIVIETIKIESSSQAGEVYE